MPETWTPQGPEKLVVGERYRLVMVTRAPYNALVRSAIETQFRGRAIRNRYKIIRFEYIEPLWSAHSNELAPWSAIMVFELEPTPEVMQAGLDPRVLWSLAGFIITAALAFTLIETRLERLLGKVGEVFIEPVFNPGFLLLAFGAFALFFFGRKTA